MGVVLVLGLAVRMVWGLSRPVDEGALAALPDQGEYLAAGRNLLAGRGLGFTDTRFGDFVYAFRTPGYPLLIAACGGQVRVVRSVQALLETATVLAAYLLARRWLSPRAATVAAGLVACNPFLIYFSSLILSETLFTALVAWGMVLLVHREGRWWIWGGLILCLAILVRPGSLVLPLALAIVGALTNRSASGPYQRWPLPVGTTMVVMTALVLLPWSARNYLVVHRWVWTSTNGGFTAYDGFNPDATGASDQTFVAQMPQLRRMNEVDRSDYLSAQAKAFVRDRPQRVAELSLAKVSRTWSPWPLSAEFSRPIYVALAAAFAVPFFMLVIVGASYRTLPQMAKLFLLTPAIYLTLAAIMSVGSLRYRIPAEVPLAVIAAAGARQIFHLVAQQPPWRRVSTPSDEAEAEENDADDDEADEELD
jgi:4-amino-4-deoxy-L-arabinose transferase-like glycosyltransferase